MLQPPSIRPKDNKSFDNLVDAHRNPTKVKLRLFKDVASMLNGFLVQFQTDNPWYPLSDEIDNIMRRLMKFLAHSRCAKKQNRHNCFQKVDVEKKRKSTAC